MRLLLLISALAVISLGQDDCTRGACYPPTGDLLLGRGHQLQSSSTCGLHGSEVFCSPFQQWKMRCCPCDSRNPAGRLAHTVRDVLSTSGPDRWWQSKKDANPVTLLLDLQNLFQLDNLILTFKGPRPNALVIEKTLDNGKTWQPALYMADNCPSAFPTVPMATPRNLEETYCYTMVPTGTNPYSDQIIQFSPLRQYSYVPVPKDKKIEELSGLTGLRVRLTELGDVPRLPGRAFSRYYALREMRVMGSCMCHGHANRCLPETNTLSTDVEVSPQCDCQHNTAGVNCERCADLYNDLPWRPAQEGNTHTCKACECNNHAQRCRFDQAVYEASGRRSGGVCEGCRHHTTGPKCDQCAPGYQPNPRSSMDRPDACIRCNCNADGSVGGAQCDDITGSCQCKANVEGPTCDRCKKGYYGLSASNPLGCTKCSCSPDGSTSPTCDPVTGQCPCRTHHHGLTCDQCSPGYWKPFWTGTCEPCKCDPTNSISTTCDQWTGQCQCRTGFGGRTCGGCPDNMYGDPLLGCRPCKCSPEGTAPEGCDKKTGLCLCKPGVTGPRCDSCSRGHCDSFPTCEACPSCFSTLDAQLRNFTLSLERLSPNVPTSGSGRPKDLGPRIRAMEAKLTQIKDSIPLPPNSVREVNDAITLLRGLRDRMDQVNRDLLPLNRVPGLDSQLDDLQALLDSLGPKYNIKKDALDKSVSANNAGALKAIKNAYDQSTDAAKSVDASGKTVERSETAREDAKEQDGVQTDNIRELNKLDKDLASKPNLTPVAKKVCGSTRTTPCTPLHCEGEDLCPPEGAPPCVRGQSCVGALPLGKQAVNDTEDVKNRLKKLNGKITDAAEKLKDTQDTTNQLRQSNDKLANQLKKTRDDLEADLTDTRDVVKQLKDFLSDPKSDLNHIKEVSDWILSAKLPLSLAALKRKLEELKTLAAGLPDSTAVLEEAEPQLDKARRLLEEAQNARDAALRTKGEVDDMLDNLDTVKGSLTGLEDKVQDSLEILDNLNSNLDQVKAQLAPAEKTLGEVATLAEGMKPQLVSLRGVLLDGGQAADEATGEAQNAKEEADAAAKDLAELEKQLKRLKEARASSGRGDGAESAGDRLMRLQEEATSLAKDTGDMLKALAGKADTLRDLKTEVLQKSHRLDNLETRLQQILADLQNKADILSTCQG